MSIVTPLLFSHVVNAATFEFIPSRATFDSCSQRIDIYIDPQGSLVNSADIEFSYDKNKVEIIDFDQGTEGKQIQPGESFQNFWGNVVNENTGSVLLAGGNFTDNDLALSSKLKFATVNFLAKNINAGEKVNFTIRFDGVGETLDSNIAEANNGLDLLSSVVNGSYTLATGCDSNGKEIAYYQSITLVSFPANPNISYPSSDETQLEAEGNANENIEPQLLSYELYEYISFFCLCFCCPAIIFLLIILRKRRTMRQEHMNTKK